MEKAMWNDYFCSSTKNHFVTIDLKKILDRFSG